MHLITSILFAFTGTVGLALGITAAGSLFVASLNRAYSLCGFAYDIERRV